MKLSVWRWLVVPNIVFCTHLSALGAPAAQYHLECPPIFEAKAVVFVAGQSPAGWQPFMPSTLTIQSGFLMYGPPELKRQSQPDSFKDSRRATVATWDLREIPSDEKWLSCGYGDAQELTLSKALPPDVAKCTVTATKNERGWVTSVAAQCEPLRSK